MRLQQRHRGRCQQLQGCSRTLGPRRRSLPRSSGLRMREGHPHPAVQRLPDQPSAERRPTSRGRRAPDQRHPDRCMDVHKCTSTACASTGGVVYAEHSPGMSPVASLPPCGRSDLARWPSREVSPTLSPRRAPSMWRTPGRTARSAKPLPYDHSPSRRQTVPTAYDGGTGSAGCSMSISSARRVPSFGTRKVEDNANDYQTLQHVILMNSRRFSTTKVSKSTGRFCAAASQN
jgi:hypothetical protein